MGRSGIIRHDLVKDLFWKNSIVLTKIKQDFVLKAPKEDGIVLKNESKVRQGKAYDNLPS